jgi:hypothetical protein
MLDCGQTRTEWERKITDAFNGFSIKWSGDSPGRGQGSSGTCPSCKGRGKLQVLISGDTFAATCHGGSKCSFGEIMRSVGLSESDGFYKRGDGEDRVETSAIERQMKGLTDPQKKLNSEFSKISGENVMKAIKSSDGGWDKFREHLEKKGHETMLVSRIRQEVLPDFDPHHYAKLASDWGVSSDALFDLEIVHDGNEWLCPEYGFRDGGWVQVGYHRRPIKLHVQGTHRGLTIPTSIRLKRDLLGDLFIVEGVSCTAALLTVGLQAVGKPSNVAGKEDLITFLESHKEAILSGKLTIISMGENDETPDGKWPGRDGAVSIALAIDTAFGPNTARLALPKSGFKDSREVLNEMIGKCGLDPNSLYWASKGAPDEKSSQSVEFALTSIQERFKGGLQWPNGDEETRGAIGIQGGGLGEQEGRVDELASLIPEAALPLMVDRIVERLRIRDCLIGKFIRDNENTAPIPQPRLALFSGLATGGALLSRKVKFGSTRPNVYLCAIGPSGCGKEWTRTVPASCLEAANPSVKHLPKPRSEAAVLTHLKSHPKLICFWDEIGEMLPDLTGKSKHSASHIRGISGALTETFTSSHKRNAHISAYADPEKDIVLDRPCLSIFSTTTPHQFKNGITLESAVNGFWGRWLLVEAPEVDLEPKSEVQDYIPSPDILDILAAWEGLGDLVSESVGLEADIPADAQAKKALASFTHEMFEIKKTIPKDNPLRVLFRNDYASKIALILACCRSWPQGQDISKIEITKDDAEIACDIVRYSQTLLFWRLGGISDSEHEHNVKDVLDVIKKIHAGGRAAPTLKLISDRRLGLKLRELEDILRQLCVTGRVQKQVSTRGKDCYVPL